MLISEEIHMEKKILSRLFMAAGLTAILIAGLLHLSLSIYAAQTEIAARIEMEDGEYAIDVTMEGGSGKSAIDSPATLIVTDGRAYARVEWSSSNYDYMKVAGTKYALLDEEGNSTFEIPITVFDEPMLVIGNTTAMSTPHEVEYKLTFAADSITARDQSPQTALIALSAVILVAALLLAFFFISRKRRRLKK